MNSTPQNFSTHSSSLVSSTAEDTLHLIARLPAPQGLEDRVIAGLQAAPRADRVLHWPGTMKSGRAWMRGAAAAAIVFVVAGGGWGIYSRVSPAQPGKVLVMPRGSALGSAGAIRTPDTLQGPIVAKPATAKANGTKAVKKTSARAVHAQLHAVPAAAESLAAGKPEVSVAK